MENCLPGSLQHEHSVFSLVGNGGRHNTIDHGQVGGGHVAVTSTR